MRACVKGKVLFTIPGYNSRGFEFESGPRHENSQSLLNDIKFSVEAFLKIQIFTPRVSFNFS